ncbi:unnamed protein product, partial [Rodentolepis nana]|uniref:Mixed-lineage leukemia protein mll n=1 Tax=Rodentolepis nana TaxID=102285 RepID=A0A0R3TAW5_RODNA
PINPSESIKPQDVAGAQIPIPIHSCSPPIVQQSSRHHQLLSTTAAAVAPIPPGLPNPPPSVQLVIPPPPPAASSTSRKSGQMLSNVFNQLLHSEQDSTIASLLSSSDGQSMGTPASMEPSFHPRSPPLSVPSNCSYPATPGMNSNLSVNNPNVGSVGPVPDPSPINAIFDATAGTNTDLSDGRGDSNPQPTVPPQPPPPPPPRGLAAYLQKSRHHAEAVASPEEGDAYARQHGSVPPMSSSASSPWTERRSGAHASTVSNVGAGVYPTSSSSLTSTPNGQEAGIKEKRGRRRKSELEGLINWQIRDQTTPLKKQHSLHSHQIPPILETNSPPHQHPSSSHHSSRADVNPSDNEVISGFTEPLGERVKRRRQQHKTPPRSVSGCGDTVLMNKAPTGKSGCSNKNSGSKRPREDTPSEISLSPKRERRGRPPRHHQIPSSEESEEEVGKIGGDDGRQIQDDNASISSCLTDSPVPRKHFLQRLVEESTSRSPSLQRHNNLQPAPMSGTPVPADEHVSSHYINSPSRKRLKKTSSSRASTSPPPLLPFQHDSSCDKKERHRLKKRRQIHQPPFSSDDEDEDEEDQIRRNRNSSHRSMLVADQLPQTKHKPSHGRIADVSSPSSQVHRKRRKAPAISSSSSTLSSAQSSSSSSEDFKSASFGKQSQRRRKNTSHSSQEEKPTIQRVKRELTPSTDPCTDSSEYEACENDGLVSSSKYDELLSDLSDSDRAEMIIEAEKRIAEEVAKFAATATDFSNHISQFLLRVGGLDLLKFAGEMNVTAVDPVAGHGDDSATMVDQTPVEARLSRREVNALYNEAEEVRVAGSISDEPSGRLVRFLNLLRVHIRDASALMAPNPTIADFKDLIQRRKARLDRRNAAGGGGNSDNSGGNRELISEAILWSHPVWMRVLRGLDSALIALHIIAGPDVPRGRLLAMEELVESITAITQFHFNRLTSVIHLPQGGEFSLPFYAGLWLAAFSLRLFECN